MSAAFAAGYIRTCCSSAFYIVNLRSHALQSFVATHCCPTFLHAARMPSTSLICIRVLQNLIGTSCCATFVRAARMLSTPLTCVRTCCSASLVPTAVLHSHLLCIWRQYCWLHSYALLVCRQHRRPAWVRGAEPCRSAQLSYIPTCYMYAAIAAGYIHTRCLSAIYIVDLRGYKVQNLVTPHGCPTFLHAACMPPLPLATSVHTARLPSTSSTCIRTRCRASLLPTAVLHSYALLVCGQHR